MAIVAITDHDTLAGVRELRAAGLGRRPSRRGPQVITGLEINTMAREALPGHELGRDGEELHILGYGVDPDDGTFAAALARQREGRRTRILRTLDRLREQGMSVDEHLDAHTLGELEALGRPHVARALVRAGYCTSVEDAFDRFLGHGRPCYVPRHGMGPREAIERIRSAGGLPVLAHSPTAPDRREVIETLVGWGLAGLEVYYRRFSPEEVERMAAFAAELGLLATGGSDYHGDGMAYASARATTWVPRAAGEALIEALAGRASEAVPA